MHYINTMIPINNPTPIKLLCTEYYYSILQLTAEVQLWSLLYGSSIMVQMIAENTASVLNAPAEWPRGT